MVYSGVYKERINLKRMSLSYTDEIGKWLEKESKKNGATKAGVIRSLIKKEIKGEKK